MENKSNRKRNRKRFWTGEDIDMFRENEYSRRERNNENICDKHIDGA